MRAITITISHLLSRLEDMNKNEHLRTRAAIAQRLCETQGLPPMEAQVIGGIEFLNVSESELRRSIHDAILTSLSYPSMANRYESVVEAHPETFKWAFVDSTTSNLTWSNLSDWLKGGSGVYWICGKAGSGKSTLMKHIYDDRQTRELLGQWATTSPFCLASFFFWNSGTVEQKSQIGLLRSLLFQILEQYPELLRIVFPTAWVHYYSFAVQGFGMIRNCWTEPWSLESLKNALRALANQKAIPLKIFLLLDGLDEVDGDHEEIAQLMHEITHSKDVKICLSSRPWVVFEDLFGSSPMLRLQNLTRPDIEKFVRDKLHLNTAYQRLVTAEPPSQRDLVNEIVDKSDGVFLWVKLVIQSLLNGIRNRDDLSDLWQRFDLIPPELKPLYNHFLTRIEPIYLQWVSKTFQLVRLHQFLQNKHPSRDETLHPFKISFFLFAIEENIDCTLFQECSGVTVRKETRQNPTQLPSFLPINRYDTELGANVATILQRKCENESARLTARCAGFLEVETFEGKINPHSSVRYFHRSARDFLETEENWSKIVLQTEDTNFCPSTAMMRSSFIELQLPPYLIEAEGPIFQVSVAHRLAAFLTYAHYADAHTKSHEAQFSLLDQLLVILVNDENKWLMGRLSNYSGTSFLELSTIYGLSGYFHKKLSQQREKPTQSLATSLLQNLAKQINSTPTGLPFVKVEMVENLLTMGADPNRRDHSKTPTPWEQILNSNVLQIACSTDCPEFSHHCTKSFLPNMIKIMYALVLAGAYSKARVVDRYGRERSAIQIIQIVMKAFPQDAAPLLYQLEHRASGLSRRWNLAIIWGGNKHRAI